MQREMTNKLTIFVMVVASLGRVESARAGFDFEASASRTEALSAEARAAFIETKGELLKLNISEGSLIALDAAKQGADKIAALMGSFGQGFGELGESFDALQAQEREWIKAVIAKADAEQPQFLLVVDGASYAREFSKVINFERSLPPETMAGDESSFLEAAARVSSTGASVRRFLFMLAGGDAMTLVGLHTDVSPTIDYIRQAETAVRESLFVIDQMTSVVKQQRHARPQGAAAVADAWRFVLRDSLASVNAGQAAAIADAAERSERGLYTYLEADSIASVASRAALLMFTRGLAPLHARRIGVVDMRRLQAILDNLDRLDIDTANLTKIREVTEKAKAELHKDQLMINGAALYQLEDYRDDRNNYVRRFLRRPTMTDSCRELGNAMLTEPDPFEHEEKFIKFRATCQYV